MVNEKKDNVIKTKSFDFAVKVIRSNKKLKSINEFDLSRQLVRSGTSIGANVEEATAAQTKKDFITKMSIASKEARETKYWLRLLHEAEVIEHDFAPLMRDIDEIISILTAIVKTSQEKLYTTPQN